MYFSIDWLIGWLIDWWSIFYSAKTFSYSWMVWSMDWWTLLLETFFICWKLAHSWSIRVIDWLIDWWKLFHVFRWLIDWLINWGISDFFAVSWWFCVAVFAVHVHSQRGSTPLLSGNDILPGPPWTGDYSRASVKWLHQHYSVFFPCQTACPFFSFFSSCYFFDVMPIKKRPKPFGIFHRAIHCRNFFSGEKCREFSPSNSATRQE